MGLKNRLNKMRSFLFDEEEEEEKVPVKPKKKKEKETNIEEEKVVEKKFEDLYFEDVSEMSADNSTVQSRASKKENEFKFPNFDDDDFMVTKKAPEPIVYPEIKKEEKPVLYQGSKRKEETKKFKPSPIISPIYGLLDNEGNKIEKNDNSNNVSSSYKEENSIDEIRKKAYGSLDLELENTLKKLSNKTIEEAEREMEKEEKEIELSRTKKTIVTEVDPIVRKNNEKDDDMILPNINFKEIDVDVERNKKNNEVYRTVEEDDDDDDTKEQDLFHLIDTMYKKEDNN